MIKRFPLSLRFLISFLLGAGMVMSFAPFYQWYLAPLVLVGLLGLIEKQSPRRAFFIGWGFGLGLFTFGLWWINVSLSMFGGAPIYLSALLVILLATYLGLYYGLLTWVTRKIASQTVIAVGVVFPLVGVLLEALRGVLFTGFPWLALGYSMTDLLFAQFLFPVMGALMSSIWIYWVAGILYLLIRWVYHSYQKRKGCKKEGAPQASPLQASSYWLALLPILFGVVLFGWVYYLEDEQSELIEPFAKPINVALLQGNIDQSDKFAKFTFWENIDTYVAMTLEHAKTSDLIIWPETAIADIYIPDSELEKNLHYLTKEDDVNLMIGIFTGSYEESHFENSLLSFGKEEGEIEVYSKRHLLPFGEYIPFRSLLRLFEKLVYIPFNDLTPGAPIQKPFTLFNSEAKGSASICFEAVFGNELRHQARESQFLINVSNDAWFGDSHGPWQHLQITRARSIEMARPMVRATNDGITLFINERGETQSMADRFVTTALVDNVQPMKGLTAYVKLGDRHWLWLFVGGLILAIGLDRLILYTMKRKRAIASVEHASTKESDS